MKKRFMDHLVEKTYMAVTRGVPNPPHGRIDIPLGVETAVGKHFKVCL